MLVKSIKYLQNTDSSPFQHLAMWKIINERKNTRTPCTDWGISRWKLRWDFCVIQATLLSLMWVQLEYILTFKFGFKFLADLKLIFNNLTLFHFKAFYMHLDRFKIFTALSIFLYINTNKIIEKQCLIKWKLTLNLLEEKLQEKIC